MASSKTTVAARRGRRQRPVGEVASVEAGTSSNLSNKQETAQNMASSSASSAEQSVATTSGKRGRPVDEVASEEAGTSITPAKKRRMTGKVIDKWADIPEWKTDRCPLLEMPVEILDKIFGPESDLQLQDYLAFSGTCRMIKKAFTEEIWQALCSYTINYSQRRVVDRIFSKAWVVNNSAETVAENSVQAATCVPQTPQSPKKGRSAKKAIMTYKDVAVERVNHSRCLSTAEAKNKYKLTDKELLSLPFTIKRNPHNPRGPPMRSFKEAPVYALAMRVHGGPLGHAAHIKKLADKSAKAKATRVKNGTVPVKTAKPRAPKLSLTSMIIPLLDMFDDDYDGYDDY